MTLSQAAQLLKVSEKSIRRYIKAGRIKAVLIKGERGNEYRINKEQLKVFNKPARGKNSHRTDNKLKKQFSPNPPKTKEEKKSKIQNNCSKPIQNNNDNINTLIAPRIDSIKEILEKKLQDNLGYLNIENQRENNIDYKLLYERLLAKYEQALIMIGSLEAQQLNIHQRPSDKKIEEMEKDLAKQEELILGLYQDLRLYKQERDVSRY
uniref:Helix-turn-helix domain-containing protein n=1 Tax=candidate division CPR3 bacterium TaxID=2268181 RepID=A0A7C4LZX9_UNCC3